MTSVQLKFREIGQLQQWVGPLVNESMVAAVLFDLVVDDVVHSDLTSRIRLTPGGNYEADLLEVELPDGYTGPMNYEGFRDCVESYYRHVIGEGGVGINLGPGASANLLQNRFVVPFECVLDVA